MNPEAMATKMAAPARALPHRILLVDDDDLELELMADRLETAGFQVARAVHGEQALQMAAEQWYPVVITDWQMPVMDGIAFTEALRARGVDDTYIIMLTMRDAHVDYERGYVSGVDDYLSKKVPDVELFARIHAAFNTLALRRSLERVQGVLEESVTIDAASGAFAPSELQRRLHAEIRRAQRYGRQLSVIALNVAAQDGAAPAAEVMRGVVDCVSGCVRAYVDWVGRDEAAHGATLVVVLPEAAVGDTPIIKERMLHRLGSEVLALGAGLTCKFGVSSLDRAGDDGVQIEAREMLEAAVLCMHCSGRASTEQLRAVQRSVSGHVAIVCRHGYAVDDACTLKAAAMSTADTPDIDVAATAG